MISSQNTIKVLPKIWFVKGPGDISMKCTECKREATYNSPKNYCDLHWHMWFCDGWPKKDKIEALQQTWRDHGKPDDWESQLEEFTK